MTSRHAQGSLEFTMITIAMMLVFASIIIIVEIRFLSIEQDRVDSLGYEMLDIVETELLLAELAGNGYVRTFTLPATLSGLPYNIYLNENTTSAGSDELIVVLESREYLRFLSTDVNGTLTTSQNTVKGGSIVQINP